MPATLLLTDALADSLADAVRRGIPIESACGAAGISQQQYHAWVRAAESGHWPDGTPLSDSARPIIAAFAEKVRRARDEHMNAMIARVEAAANAVNEKTGIPEWRAADAFLSKHPVYRKVWHEERHTTIEQTGTVLHEHQLVEKLSMDELREAYTALDALPPPTEP